MSRMTPIVALGLLLGAAAVLLPLQAQTVWRCGADGRSFSDRPCADGQRLQRAELADRRSADEVAAAQAVVVRQQRLAEALRQERLQRERVATPALDRHAAPPGRHGSAGVTPKREAKTRGDEAQHPSRHRSQSRSQRPSQPRSPATDGIWRAVAPASPRTKD
jgi:hypothetical protein